MKWVLFISAIVCLVIGHLLKVARIKKFVEIYEKPNNKNLVQAISLGYLINFFLPLRIGELFRAFYQGRKMKNGISFGLATVIVDRILDIIVVFILFIAFYFMGFKNSTITNSIFFYIFLALVILLLIILLFGEKFNHFIKNIIKIFAQLFNSKIELNILKLSWYVIDAFKNLIKTINKLEVLLFTLGMWLFYILSYALLTYSLTLFSYEISFIELFTILFSKNNIDAAAAYISLNNPYMLAYLLLPIIILFILSFIPLKEKQSKKKYLELLPQINTNDKLLFLQGYFSGNSRKYFEFYMKLNRDVSIIQDCSAGSNATTILCKRDEKVFFRKYSFGDDSNKLYEQICWIKNNDKNIPVTKIENVNKGDGYCCYDMPYLDNAVNCFNYVHTEPLDKGWEVIHEALDCLNNKLHKKTKRPAEPKLLDKYINTKVLKNLDKIEKIESYVKQLQKYDSLIINGKNYPNLSYFKKYLDKDYLKEIFRDDVYSDIHGDFTIENIICLKKSNKKTKNFYLIDPNVGNLHDSPNLDYAKLLQSLHGGYEFLMNTKSISINKNQIDFLYVKSDIYENLYKKYDEFLNKTFDYNTVRSIYFHEIIHWLRLMPYKIEKNGERAVLFYCGLIKVLDDVIKRFGE